MSTKAVKRSYTVLAGIATMGFVAGFLAGADFFPGDIARESDSNSPRAIGGQDRHQQKAPAQSMRPVDKLRPDSLPVLSEQPNSEVAQLTRDVLGEKSLSARWGMLVSLCNGLDSENWQAVLTGFKTDSLETGRLRPQEYDLFLNSLGQQVGASALDYWVKEEKSDWHAVRVMDGWATADPAAAIRYLESNPDLSSEVRMAAAKGIAKTDPRTAFGLSLSNSKMLDAVSRAAIDSLGVQEAAEALNAVLETAPEDANQKGVQEAAYMNSFGSAIREMAERSGDPRMFCDWLESMAETGELPKEQVSQGAYIYARKDPAAAVEWWLRITPADQQRNCEAVGVGPLFEGLMSNPEQAAEWCRANRGNPCYDSIAGRLVVDERAGEMLGDEDLISTMRDPVMLKYVRRKLETIREQAK